MDIAGIDQQCTLTKYVDTREEKIKIESDKKIASTNDTTEARGVEDLEHMEISEENQHGIVENSVPEEVRKSLQCNCITIIALTRMPK